MMTIIVKEIFDALKEAGVKDETAQKASESFANQDVEIKEVKGELQLHRWMLTLIVGLLITIVVKYLTT